MEGIVLGQYIPGNSFIHRLDPRSKLVISIILLWMVFLLTRPAEFVGFSVFIVFSYFMAGVTGSFLRVLKPGFYLILFTLTVNMVFTPGHSIFSLGPVAVTREGFILGSVIGLKLVFLISVSSLITLTTSPVRMTDGLERLLRPLRKIGFPVSELGMMMNIALRFIPTFWEETDKIKKAQVSRGADFNTWNLSRRAKYATALLVPLFVSAFRKSDELAVSMEARGYSVGMERTSLYELKMHKSDYAALVVVFVLFIAFQWYRTPV